MKKGGFPEGTSPKQCYNRKAQESPSLSPATDVGSIIADVHACPMACGMPSPRKGGLKTEGHPIRPSTYHTYTAISDQTRNTCPHK